MQGKTALIACLAGAALLCLVACAREEADYFPSRAGLTWVYAVHTKNRREQSHHRHLVMSLAPARLDDRRTLLRRRRHDGSVAAYVIRHNGIFHVGPTFRGARSELKGAGQRVLGFPLRVGTAWERNVETGLVPQSGCGVCTTTGSIEEISRLRYRIVDVSAVADVPAGVFENCIKVRGTGRVEANANNSGMEPVEIRIDAREWYAPDVGLVKMIWHERPDDPLFSEGRSLMELDAFLGR